MPDSPCRPLVRERQSCRRHKRHRWHVCAPSLDPTMCSCSLQKRFPSPTRGQSCLCAHHGHGGSIRAYLCEQLLRALLGSFFFFFYLLSVAIYRCSTAAVVLLHMPFTIKYRLFSSITEFPISALYDRPNRQEASLHPHVAHGIILHRDMMCAPPRSIQGVWLPHRPA
jgi:hypothetical protein